MRPIAASKVAQSLEAAQGLVDRGESQSSRALLISVPVRFVPRALALTFAQVSRRAGVPELGAKLLHRYVRTSGRKKQDATPAETAEFAACLIQLEATDEGLKLLEEIDPSAVPLVNFYRALGHFKRWEYAEARPLLEQFIATPGLTPYHRFVGKLNLVSAALYEHDFQTSERLLLELERETVNPVLNRFQGNVVQLHAQSLIGRREWDKADALLKSLGKSDSLFVEKWRVFLEAYRSPSSKSWVKGIEEVRAKAISLSHFETVRECDRILATHLGNLDLAQRLLVGTPYASYQQRIRREIQSSVELEAPYNHRLGPASGRAATLNLITCEFDGSECDLRTGLEIHRLLAAFTTDFYRPLRLAGLHEALYPNDYFNPDSSPHRVHSAILRFRRWAKAKKIPLKVERVQGFYQLVATRPIEIIVKRTPTAVAQSFWSDRIQQVVGGEWFGVSSLVDKMAISRRTALRVVNGALEANRLERTGQGRATKYRLRLVA